MREGGRDEPVCRARKRAGRCYELALRALLDLSPETRWRLVHGAGAEPEAIAGHAWLTDGRHVYDPVEDWRGPVAEYARRAAAATIREYSRAEAAKWAVRTRHPGPWE
ncbi:MAG TPA: hypothetical protein VMF62_13505 [Acetobacteraceae bacterium]|nr:hypothetical protein [Acetobacteraceae bacterium]